MEKILKSIVIKVVLIVAIICFACCECTFAAIKVFNAKREVVDFQTISYVFIPSTSKAPTGYVADNGLAYNTTTGYGWINPSTKAPQDMTASMRIRTGSSAAYLLGTAQMQATTNGQVPGTWECAVPNGTYRVTVSAGDEGYYDSDHEINVEGLPVIADLVTSASAKHKIATCVVQVSDGKLTVDASGGVNSKINYITIAAATTVTDTTAPTVSVRLAGTQQSGGAYSPQVQVFATATDAGSSGLSAFQYSLNNAAFQAYTQPFTVQTGGTYSLLVKAVDANNNTTTSAPVSFTVAGTTVPAGFQTISYVFIPSTSKAPTGYVADNGLAYSTTTGYGWINPSTKAPQDMTASMRIRTGSSAAYLLGTAQMQATTNGQVPGTWECAVPNGTYRVTVSAGDEGYYDSDHEINVEGLPVIADLVTSASAKHKIATCVVQVSDGKLTVDASGGVNSKINYITIAAATTVTDTTAPTVSVRLAGTQQSGGAYSPQVQVFATATDAGSSGLSAFQYSLNNAAFQAYTQPFTVQTGGTYSLLVKAVDANNNTTTSAPVSFTVAGTTAPATKSTGGYLALQNPNVFPSNDHLAFSYLQTPWRRTSPDTTPYNANHNIIKLRINNEGAGKLTVNKLTLSAPAAWKILAINTDSTLQLPITLNSEAYADVSIEFDAKNAASRVKIFHDTLYIASNDSIAPLKKVMLDGLWQLHGEGLTEPWAQEILDLYDFKTNTGYDHDDNGLKGSAVVPNSSEVAASYFVQADPSKPVTVYEIAQYHGCCNAVTPFTYYVKGSTTQKTLFTTNNLDGQSVLPREIASNTLLSRGTFSSDAPFGFTSDQTSFSDRTKNYQGKIGMRFWKVLDANGKIVPNAILAGVDYLGTQFSNGDYQDDVYYIDNVKPDSGSVFYSTLIATPADVNFSSVLVGATGASSVNLLNSGMTYPGGGADPAITIKSITIVGPNASEFSIGKLASSTINVQSSTNLSLNFTPQSLGIKNAALMIDYGNTTPLRVPLYGIANTAASTVNIVKRYKGGSDVDLHISNLLWSSDKSIRQGSIKLDMQTIKSEVAGTVADSLYQTYLSAATNLAVTSLQIPVTNGNYMVRMHFVENYYTTESQRIFNINIENQPVLNDFDIFKEVGYRSALVKDFNVTVADGNLSVKFTPTANRLALAAIEIYQAVPVTKTMAVLASTPANAVTDSLSKNSASVTQVYLFPNPGDGNNINLNASKFAPFEKVNYTLSNMFGLPILKGSFMADVSGSAVFKLNPVYKLNKGIYVVNTFSSSGNFSSKLIVQ